uniref:Secreted protein n=1 Tax=Panagrellus redivivus TaxID=6233 RepID=A0A7E4VKC0_PANRE
MLLALGMGQVGSFVGVERETKLAFIASEMIPHKIGIFVDVYRLQGQQSQTFRISRVTGHMLRSFEPTI